MGGKYLHAFNEDDVCNWKYCPICGEELLWNVLDVDRGHITCAGEHPGEVVEFDVWNGDEIWEFNDWRTHIK